MTVTERLLEEIKSRASCTSVKGRRKNVPNCLAEGVILNRTLSRYAPLSG